LDDERYDEDVSLRDDSSSISSMDALGASQASADVEECKRDVARFFQVIYSLLPPHLLAQWVSRANSLRRRRRAPTGDHPGKKMSRERGELMLNNFSSFTQVDKAFSFLARHVLVEDPSPAPHLFEATRQSRARQRQTRSHRRRRQVAKKFVCFLFFS